jgi:hypothetical protein
MDWPHNITRSTTMPCSSSGIAISWKATDWNAAGMTHQLLHNERVVDLVLDIPKGKEHTRCKANLTNCCFAVHFRRRDLPLRDCASLSWNMLGAAFCYLSGLPQLSGDLGSRRVVTNDREYERQRPMNCWDDKVTSVGKRDQEALKESNRRSMLDVLRDPLILLIDGIVFTPRNRSSHSHFAS